MATTDFTASTTRKYATAAMSTLTLSRDLFLPQEVALFVAVAEVDHRGWRVAHPVKDVSIHTDVPAQRSTVILSYWDDTPDRTVDGGVDVEVHTIAKQV